MKDEIPQSLAETETTLARLLHAEEDLGVEIHSLCLRPGDRPTALAVYLPGMADEDRVRQWVLEPVRQVALGSGLPPQLSPVQFSRMAPTPRTVVVDSLAEATDGILLGATALFFEGSGQALLIGTQADPAPPAAGPVIFGRDLLANATLIRDRLRDLRLRVEPHRPPRGHPTGAAILYLEERADPELVQAMREWLKNGAGEESLRQGGTSSWGVKLGLLPPLLRTDWPAKAALLLGAGYVAVLIDSLPHALIAPVTAPALLSEPGDDLLRRPVAGLKQLSRVALALVVVLFPALTVGTLEYHQELLPTGFALSLAAVRENAAFPVVMSVFGLEGVKDLLWSLPFRLHLNLAMGHSVAVYVLITGLLTLIGLIGPVAAIAAIIGLVASLGLPGYDLVYMVRLWRWPMLASAAVFGLFGMAAVTFVLAAYLTQARSYGLPFLGETGIHFDRKGPSPAPGGRGNDVSKA